MMKFFESVFGTFALMLALILMTLLADPFIPQADAGEFDLGGIEISIGDSPTVMTDVQIVGRSGGDSFVGGGACSVYAWRVNVADVFNADILSFCGIASGTFEGEDPGRFVGGLGISPVSLFGGLARTFVGFDLRTGDTMRGAMTSIAHDLLGR